MFDYTNSRICELWPKVVRIEISVTQTYPSAFKTFSEGYKAVFTTDSKANFNFRCINDDCTDGNFDLYGVVSGMAAHRIEHSTGTLTCEGNEAKDHDNRCPCILEYEINIEYSKSQARESVKGQGSESVSSGFTNRSMYLKPQSHSNATDALHPASSLEFVRLA